MDNSGPSVLKEHSGLAMRYEHALQILELVFSYITQEKAQMYRRGRQCKVSERDCGLPAHTVSSPG